MTHLSAVFIRSVGFVQLVHVSYNISIWSCKTDCSLLLFSYLCEDLYYAQVLDLSCSILVCLIQFVPLLSLIVTVSYCDYTASYCDCTASYCAWLFSPVSLCFPGVIRFLSWWCTLGERPVSLAKGSISHSEIPGIRVKPWTQLCSILQCIVFF